MAELNEKLIACVLDHIASHPHEYDQNEWCHIRDQEQDGEFCGTQGCFAGWAVLLSTPVEKWRDMPDNQAVDYTCGDGWYKTKAAQLLGLTKAEATRLFQGSNGTPLENVQVIKQRLRSIRMGRGLPPDGPPREKAKEDDNVSTS